jgi:mannose/cellobiose epimerase-like protein (N-acyl-D-glucosamine 2-epimerase family)
MGKDAPETPGIRIMDDWMLFLRAATRMLVHGDDADMEALAERCVDTIMNRYYNPSFGLITELLRRDHTPFDNELGQFVNLGNDFQALWHVMDEALRRKDRTLFDVAAERLERHIAVAWDDVYGGVFTLLRHVDENRWETGKTHYAQTECLNGLLMAIEHRGDVKAGEWYSTIYTYAEEVFPQRKYGYPLWIVGSDRRVSFRENASRIENFHLPRALMLNLTALDRIVDRKGGLSGAI